MKTEEYLDAWHSPFGTRNTEDMILKLEYTNQ